MERVRPILLTSLVALALLTTCAAPPASTVDPGGLPGAGPEVTVPSPQPLPSVTPSATIPRPTAPLTQPTTSVVIPSGVARDVTYCTPGAVAVKMDLYFPPNPSRPAPVVVYVHGGAWKAGDKTGGVEISAVPVIAAQGYLVASLNYRLAPQFKWPAQIQDVKCAIRFLRAHATQYNLDPDRIAALGASAGGHLVALLGLTGPETGFDVGEYIEQSSRVRAVVDLFGPADLRSADFSSRQATVAREVFGARKPDDPVLVEASPVTYITKDDPPFLILQGEKDSLVPPTQSQELYSRLKDAGVPATLVMVKNAEHGFAAVGGPISPTFPELTQMILQFLDKHLQ